MIRRFFENQNIPHEVVAFSEIDKYAVEAYRAIHDDYETLNMGDIKEITHLPSCDLLTYGFPCQDISIAGYGQGIKEGTRSGLLIEVERLLDIASQRGNLPKYLILENVKALVQKKHRKDFDIWLEKLESLGYSNYWQLLNAKDFGIPQSRERVFVVSILGEHEAYEFPEKQELKLRLRDLIEDEVPENYYLKDEKVQDFISRLGKQGYLISGEIAYALASKNTRNNLVIDNDISYCIDANYWKGTNLKGYFEKRKRQLVQDEDFKIRRLTPNECWRLMGFSDEAYQKARIALNNKFYKGKDRANSQQYKQAGNSVVVPVLENIFINLYK